tara:strand:+ start:938 stop:1378 length:441 start_codon:yes stop_codon:yes gene_type:complete
MDENIKIAISCDHAGKKLSDYIIKKLNKKFLFINLNPPSDESVDYPDYAHKVCDNINKGNVEYGILICGSGIGMSMAANRHKNIRAARVHDRNAVTMTRKHNNANVLCLGERMIDKNEAVKLVELFLETKFEGGRHQKRIDKIEID